MNNIDEMLSLMDLEKALKPFKYDKLNLFKLDELRGEVGRRLNQINKQ